MSALTDRRSAVTYITKELVNLYDLEKKNMSTVGRDKEILQSYSRRVCTVGVF